MQEWIASIISTSEDIDNSCLSKEFESSYPKYFKMFSRRLTETCTEKQIKEVIDKNGHSKHKKTSTKTKITRTEKTLKKVDKHETKSHKSQSESIKKHTKLIIKKQ